MSPLRLTATAEDDAEISGVVLALPRPGVCELVHTDKKMFAAEWAHAPHASMELVSFFSRSK
jgi:hypothetical protein